MPRVGADFVRVRDSRVSFAFAPTSHSGSFAFEEVYPGMARCVARVRGRTPWIGVMGIGTPLISPKVGKRIEAVRNRQLFENRVFCRKLKPL